ncbi:MAG: hypothetical protein L3J59_01250 [Methylococcaceae bacterium]|nr:hypothetical protein [Methylococcaceae bacterium]
MIHFCITFLVFLISTYPIIINASETNANDNSQESLEFINDHPILYITEETQKISGLKTLKAIEVDFNPEIISYGKAISISPLLKIRNNYFSSLILQNDLKVRLSQMNKNISRSRELHQNEIVSTRKLQKQLSQWHSEKALYDKNTYQTQLMLTTSKLKWGELLTKWATKKKSPHFDRLISGKSTLLKITMPANKILPPEINTIHISPSGNRNSAVKAIFINTLASIDNFSQGHQYIFLSNNSHIKTGMNFTAWLPQKKQNQKGVIIPDSSLVWHLGQSFVFIKTDEEHFEHRNISHPIKTINGYYIGNQINKGESIVTKGAQMLLSYEFKSEIPGDDDD